MPRGRGELYDTIVIGSRIGKFQVKFANTEYYTHLCIEENKRLFMQNTSLSSLLNNNYIDKKYESLILGLLAYNGIITINDLLNMPDPNTFHGIGKKKTMLILELQECVRQLRSCDSDTTLTVKKYGANNNHSDDILESPIIEQLASIPVEEIGRYIKCGTIPKSVQKVGVSSLKDLWCKDFDSVTTLGFSKKKAKDLQNEFRGFSQEQLEDIVFWNTNRVLPLEYDANRAIERNLQFVLDELIEYIGGCCDKLSQITKKTDRDRAQRLKTIFNRIYKENVSLDVIARELGFKDAERVRQLLYLELLDPLFRGENLKYDILKNISINSDLVKKVNDFRRDMLFSSYSVKNECSIVFFEDILDVDILQHTPLSYIVPHQEEMCYRTVIKAFFDKMTAIMECTPAEELAECIDKSEIIQRDIYNKHKTYDKRFVEHLLSDEDIIIKNEIGVILRPEYIRHFGLYELGEVIQERALARIIADAHRALHKREIVDTYYNLYGEEIDEVAIRRTSDFGCQCIAHEHWMYSNEELLSLPKFIEKFVQRDTPFYLQEVIDALKENGYPVESEETVRMYVSQYNCASHREIKQYFCHRDYLENNGGSEKWATRKTSGLNWMANAIKFLFDQHGVNELGGEKVVQYLNDNIIGSPYEGRSIELRNHLNTYLEHRSDSPFEIIRENDGEWVLSKSNQYESTDWEFYGTRGNQSYHHYLVANAESIRRRMACPPTLQELAVKLYEEKGEEILGDENSKIREGADRGRRIVLKIRQQLEAAINNNYLDHALNIVKSGRNVYVTLDTRRVNAKRTTRYISQDPKIRIEYKSVSQLNELDWDKLIPILRSELSFCQEWMDADNLGAEYNKVFDKFINFIKTDFNPNLKTILPQRLYEFFAVSDPTSDDRYCIMCNIAKNFEAFIDSIARRVHGIKIDKNNPANGIYQKSERYNFEDFRKTLHNECNIISLRNGSYQKALKYLNFVRNTDAHGQWYEDKHATDYLTEDQRNVQKILNFAALYIFTYAKYAMN